MSREEKREIVPHGHVSYTGRYSSETSSEQQVQQQQPPAEVATPQKHAAPPSNVEVPQEGPSKPNIEHFDLPPVTRHRDVYVARPQLEERMVEIPHVQYLEKIEEISSKRRVQKIVNKPKVSITERVIEIPKHIKEQKIIEVPQVQVVDHVVEVPQYITQQKIVEKPRIMLQERIIPIPKRTIEEKIIEIPQDEFDQVLKERVEFVTPAYGPAHPSNIGQKNDADYASKNELLYDTNGNPILDEDGQHVFRQYQGEPLPEGQGAQRRRSTRSSQITSGGRAVDEVVEIPHVQHVYRNIMQSVYRHIPKPVEVPMTHYKPIPIERIVDRNVPIPVELEVIQEFLCPRLEPRYVEVAVPIPVTRVIEKPVPADAMFNSVIMEAYMRGQAPTVTSCYQSCAPAPEPLHKEKMTVPELHAVKNPSFILLSNQAGIHAQPSFSQVKSFKSRGVSFGGFNIDRSRDWLTQQRSLVKEGEKNKQHS